MSDFRAVQRNLKCIDSSGPGAEPDGERTEFQLTRSTTHNEHQGETARII